MAGNTLRQLTAATYPFVRCGLFALDPERAHHLSLGALKWIQDSPLAAFDEHTFGPTRPIEIMGLTFPNRLGRGNCCLLNVREEKADKTIVRASNRGGTNMSGQIFIFLRLNNLPPLSMSDIPDLRL